MIDEFTRFSARTIINSKAVASKVFNTGSRFLEHPGKHFLTTVVNLLGILQLIDTNTLVKRSKPLYLKVHGLQEHHNQTLTTTLLIVKDDAGCDYETALSCALCTKNSLINNNGFRPFQLVFGRNTNLPNLIDIYIPAQEKLTL